MSWIPARDGKRRRARSEQPPAIIEVLETRALLATVNVTILDFAFNPDPVTIHVGDTVHWMWAASNHSTTSVAGSVESWDSGVLNNGSTFDHTFTAAGTDVYFCKIHGMDNGNGTASGMAGKIIVQPASTPPPTIPPPVSPLTAEGVMVNAKVGRTFQGMVATFTEANGKAKNFRASIDWGDQSNHSGGRIKTLGHGRFAVLGTHRFTQPGMFFATVSISDSSGHHASASTMEMIQPGRHKK